jgi:hypothetical protein
MGKKTLGPIRPELARKPVMPDGAEAMKKKLGE